MPLDSIAISALAGELRTRLTGARIDKVQQPERDLILLSVHGPAGNARLALCGGVGAARIHLTEAAYENPAQPPMFCMLLRKHLVGARITGLSQPGRERLLELELDARDELGAAVPRRLVVEMLGRASNLILLDGEGRILDCLRRVDGDMNAARQVLPGLLYRLPPALAKPDFFALSSAERRARWAAWDGQTPPEQWLLDQFSCLSPLICRELAYRCHGAWETLPAYMDALADSVEAGEFTPWMLLAEGKPKDFSFMPILQYGERMEGERFPDFSRLLDAFYTRRSQAEELRRRTSALRKTVRNAHDRTARKVALQTQELKKTADREEKRRWGDLITANLYRAPRQGAARFTVEDFYQDGSPEVAIPLDPLKSAQQNAAAYYKEYTKAKTAERYLTQLLSENRRDLEYLSSVLDELDRVAGEGDIAAIRRELLETGWLREKKTAKTGKKERAPKQAQPFRYRSSGGFEIWVGRGNVQNDELTTKLAHRGDLWFHTQKIHGSLVILRCAGADPDPESIREAAVLAATHSQAGAGGRVSVDYTRVKYVRKPSGALPGMVIYTNQTTVAAEADEALAQRLREG